MFYDLSQRGSTPKYLYLYQLIRHDILTGRLSSGTHLPSKRTLSKELGIGIITVANAYDLLQSEGYIVSMERKGFFVQNISTLQKPNINYSQPSINLDEQDSSADFEPEYFVDTKANRISLDLFPKNTWNQLMRKTLSQGNEQLYRTVPYNGLFSLRLAIANYLQSSVGIYCNPSQIVIGAGTEYLFNRLALMLGRTCVFGFEDPGNKNLINTCTRFGCECRSIPVDYGGLIVDSLEKSEVDVMHVSPDNHFPTGIRMSASRRNELINWAYRGYKRFIIEDGYDSEFLYNVHNSPTLYTMDTAGKVIYINTFSKTMVPALRISYMVLPASLMKLYKDAMGFYSCTVSSFEQYTLAQFISQGHLNSHINRLKRHYAGIRKKLVSAIGASPLNKISSIYEFDAGTHLLLTVHTELDDEAIRSAGVQKGLSLQLYSDYCSSEFTKRTGVLVINYATINPEKIVPFIARLCDVFPECRRDSQDNFDAAR